MKEVNAYHGDLKIEFVTLLHFRTGTPPFVIDDSHEKTRLKALP